MKNVTIKDVAKKAGVSYSTVSRALSGSAEISEKTRENILKICKEMNYTANTVARAMVMKSTKLIGLIVTDINNPFMSELAYHIDRQTRKRGYNIILSNSSQDPSQEEEAFNLMLGHQVDGIIICPSSPTSYANLQEYMQKIPTVFLGENLRNIPESYISVDNFLGAELGVEYLYNLGHRKILYFGQRKGSVSHQLRAEGYASACEKYNLTPQYFHNTFNATSIKNGYQLAKQLFADRPDITAIFASTDTNALGIMKAAEEAQIRIPEDLSLLGFDNIRDAGLPRIELTTVEQPMKVMASVAVDCLLDKITNEQSGYTHRILYPSIIERSSCAPVPAE
jgi:LacI family transcriptional regulator